MMARTLIGAWLLWLAWSPLALAAGSADCGALARMAWPQARTVTAHRVDAGTFVPPGIERDAEVPQVYRDAPAFCRVRAVLAPTADSHVRVEVWLPASGWNGRFRGQDNGGFAGYINYAGLATAVAQGYASASTDTGHTGQGAAWARGHRQRVIDFGYRAIHRMTVYAKAVVRAFYGRPAAYAYFAGCSNGGRQALMEAQRFPDDYDGIMAGAPAYDWTHLLANALGIAQRIDRADGYIPPQKLPMITHAVLEACDAGDGVVDGVLGDPRRCRFDPSVLACDEREAGDCLGAAQVATLETIYGGVRDADGKRIYYGLMPGAEDAPGSWRAWLFGDKPGVNATTFFVDNYFSSMVYADASRDLRHVPPAAALAMANRRTAQAMNAVDADLAPFVAGGGRLIMYHGWNDPAISPLGTIAYDRRVRERLGPQRARRAVRLYMVPGMLHCDHGPGAYAFGQNATDARADARHDMFTALVRWVERGQAPDVLVATRPAGTGTQGRDRMTRPLCPYPQVARYDGSGEPDRAASFACRPPSGDTPPL